MALPTHSSRFANLQRLLMVGVAVTAFGSVTAFQMSMVASGFKTPLPIPLAPPPPSSGLGLTSGLVSNLAEVAIKMRLKDHTEVACDVTASTTDLLMKGVAGPVTVRGRGWQSPLGLTCRAIEATVDSCELDVGRILSHRKLTLTRPAQGKAMVAFNSADFGSFITHPRFDPPSIGNTQESTIRFHKEGASVDPSAGIVRFTGDCLGAKWGFSLARGKNGVQVTTTALEAPTGMNTGAVATELTESIAKFFNTMVFELDGTFLSFRDMMVTNKGNEPTVMLALNILVKKFPSRGAAF